MNRVDAYRMVRVFRATGITADLEACGGGGIKEMEDQPHARARHAGKTAKIPRSGGITTRSPLVDTSRARAT